MKILALELSSPVGSVVFCDGDETQIARQFPADRKHSGDFYDSLSALHQNCGAPEMIVVGLGPGSYAGVRIAIATALGLKAATGARLLGFPSICAIDCAEYIVIGDARRSTFFFAHVLRGRCEEGPSLATEEGVRAKLNEWHHLPLMASQPLPQFKTTLAHPSAMVLAQLAKEADPETETQLEPIYLREPYITMPKR